MGDITFPTKRENLQREHLSNEKLWIHVGTVFNIFMRPVFTGQITILTRYLCSNDGLSGTDNYSILRKNMFVVYDRKTYCIQQDELNIDLKNLIIKSIKNEILLMAPNMKNLILDMDKIAKNTHVHYMPYCLSSFRKRYLVHAMINDCGKTAAEWISKHLNKPNLALGYIVPEVNSKRTFWDNLRDLYLSEPEERNILMPANIIPHFTLISYRSFLEVNKSLKNPVTIDKYNADICIVPNDTEPFKELEWEWIQIGNIILRNITPWQKHSIKIDLKDMPVEMKMQMIVMNCELYQSGTMQSGDEVYVHLRPRILKKIPNKREQFSNIFDLPIKVQK